MPLLQGNGLRCCAWQGALAVPKHLMKHPMKWLERRGKGHHEYLCFVAPRNLAVSVPTDTGLPWPTS